MTVPDSNINLEITKDHRLTLAALVASGLATTVTNLRGDTVYYGDRQVSSTQNQGSLTATQSFAPTGPITFLSAGQSELQVQTVTSGNVVTGSKGANAALASLLPILARAGLIIDQSSA